MVLSDLPANLRDIRLLNRWTGGTSLAARTILPLLDCPESSLLDVATGSADIPLAVAAVAAQRGIVLRVTGLDVSSDVLTEASCVSQGAVDLVQGEARRLPFEDGRFDVVSLCLALHHFDPADAVSVLEEMWRVALRGIAVVDVRRSATAYAGVWLMTHTVTRNRLTRHDGPLSVLRAYTPAEVLELARQAGIPSPLVTSHGPARLTLVADKPAHGR